MHLRIIKLESVQCCMARFVLNDCSYTSSVTRMLESLHWATLAQCCTQAKLITLYKIVNDILHIPTHNILIQSIPPYPIGSHRTHYLKVPSARLQTYKLLFSPHISYSGILYQLTLFYHLTLKFSKDKLKHHFAIPT